MIDVHLYRYFWDHSYMHAGISIVHQGMDNNYCNLHKIQNLLS